MSEITTTLKNILSEGIKLVNRAASTVADSTRYKLNEMDSISRRREAITELGEKVYALYQAGTALPEEILPLLNELRALEEGLDTMRTQRAEQKEVAAQTRKEERAARAEERAAQKIARAEARAAEKAAAKAAAEAAEAAALVIEEEPTAADAPVYDGDAPTLEVPVEEEEKKEEEPMTL